MAIDRENHRFSSKNLELSFSRQCELLGLARSSWYYRPASESEANLALMRLIDEEYTRHPFYGSRRMGAGTSQSSEYNGTSYAQLQKGAKSYGLDSKVVYGSIPEIEKELKAGKLVIAHVRPDYLFPGTTSGHYAVVTKVADGKVYMHDPANASGPMVVSVATFKKAQAGRGTWGLVSVGGQHPRLALRESSFGPFALCRGQGSGILGKTLQPVDGGRDHVSKPLAGIPAFFAIALAAFGLDQAFKHWVVSNMGLYESIPLISNLFALTYVRNIGAAFSAFSGHVGPLALIAGSVSIAIVVYMLRLKERTALHIASLGLLLGGTVGNLADRLRLGYVVDMFDLQWNGQNIFPIFNIADIAIDVGVGLLLLLFYLESRRERRAAQQQQQQDQSTSA